MKLPASSDGLLGGDPNAAMSSMLRLRRFRRWRRRSNSLKRVGAAIGEVAAVVA
jgi:hypothetical protein